MKFVKDKMYKNLLKDKDVAFIVDEVLQQGTSGADLIVTWYQQTSSNRYVSMGIDGEFHISKEQTMHYMEI